MNVRNINSKKSNDNNKSTKKKIETKKHSSGSSIRSEKNSTKYNFDVQKIIDNIKSDEKIRSSEYETSSTKSRPKSKNTTKQLTSSSKISSELNNLMNEIIGKDKTSSEIDRLKNDLTRSSLSDDTLNAIGATYTDALKLNAQMNDQIISDDHYHDEMSKSKERSNQSSSFDKYVKEMFGDDFEYKDPLKLPSSSSKKSVQSKAKSNNTKQKAKQKSKHLNLKLKNNFKIDNDVTDMTTEQKQKLINKLQLYSVNVLKNVMKAIVLHIDDDKIQRMSKRHVVVVIAEQINTHPFRTQMSINRVLNPLSVRSNKNVQSTVNQKKHSLKDIEEEEEDRFNAIELEEGIANNNSKEENQIEEEDNTDNTTDNEHDELNGFMNVFQFGKKHKCYYYATK